MRSRAAVLVVGSALAILAGCVTLQAPDGFLAVPLHFEEGKISAEVSCRNPQWAELSLMNATGEVVTVIWDTSSFTEPGGTSHRVVPEGTRYVDMKQSVPPIAVPPGSTFRRLFASADSAYYVSGQYGGWRNSPWIPADLAGCSFVIAYRIGAGPDRFMVFNGSEAAEEQAKRRREIVGTVKAQKTFVNILFLWPVERRRSILRDTALEEAQETYGPKAELMNVKYTGNWSVASLLLYFGFLGMIECAEIEADVRIAP